MLDFTLFEHVCFQSPGCKQNVVPEQDAPLAFNLFGHLCSKPPWWETEHSSKI